VPEDAAHHGRLLDGGEQFQVATGGNETVTLILVNLPSGSTSWELRASVGPPS
jgi:hypothetical protein